MGGARVEAQGGGCAGVGARRPGGRGGVGTLWAAGMVHPASRGCGRPGVDGEGFHGRAVGVVGPGSRALSARECGLQNYIRRQDERTVDKREGYY